MRTAFNLVGGAFFAIWIIEFFGYKTGEKAHVLLLTAIIVFFVKMVFYVPFRGKI